MESKELDEVALTWIEPEVVGKVDVALISIEPGDRNVSLLDDTLASMDLRFRPDGR